MMQNVINLITNRIFC